MNKHLEKYFVKTYPKIFLEMYGPVNKTCMHWGITCGDGWFNLLDSLCYKIQSRIDRRADNLKNGYVIHGEFELIPQVVAKQIKEKFGTLRFYYGGGDDTIEGYVEMAESLSAFICEECGMSDLSLGNTTHWIRNLCPKCAKKFMSEKFRENEKFVQDKKKLNLLKKVKQSKRRKK